MKIRLDNYQARYENGYLKITINGCLIVEKSTECRTRRDLLVSAYNEIERYNKENGLRWGVYFE